MTVVPLLDAHKGKHCTARPERLSFFRRIVAAVRRKPDLVGRAWTPGAAPTALLTPPDGTPVLGDRMLSDVRARYDAVHTFKSSARLTDAEIADLDARLDAALRRPVNGIYLGTLPRRKPGATLPCVEPLTDRGPGHPPWPTQEMPVYGQKPQLTVDATRNGWQ